MGFYDRTAMTIFGQISDEISPYFSEIRVELKKARIRTSIQEYISTALFTSFLVFACEIVILSYIFSLIFQSFLFGFITAFSASIFLGVVFFLAFVNYPKVMIKERSKKIDNYLPFAVLYIATISGSKLPLYRTLQVFSKFSRYGSVTE